MAEIDNGIRRLGGIGYLARRSLRGDTLVIGDDAPQPAPITPAPLENVKLELITEGQTVTSAEPAEASL
ncbi:MAG TPA: hypothetical protein VHB51_01675 [Candidatus Saccharimonadales bacterium]|nr:hypothetical protein [Candidatus Saccharimonadales bacterium]